MDSGLGDCHRLLFHDFVDGHSIDIRHLVKLVDTNYASIGQNHGTGFESPLSRVLVARHRGRLTDT